MSLRYRMYLLGAFGLSPLLAASAWNEFADRSLREQELRANLAQEASFVASEFHRRIEGTHSLLQTLAVLPVLRGTGSVTCDDLFTLIRPQIPAVIALAATDRQGNVICASDRQPGEILPSIADRPHFKAALENDRPALGVHAFGRRTGQHAIHAAAPYKDASGQTVGVVFATLSLDAIARDYATEKWTRDRVLTVIDREGTILMRQPDHQRHVGQKIAPDRWAQLRAYTQPGYYDMQSSVDGVRRVIGFSPLNAEPVGIFIGIGVSRDSAFAPLNSATWRTVLATLFAIVISFGSAWLIARNLIGKPWRRILRTAKALEQGHLDARVKVSGKGEFAELGHAFNTVADRLVAALTRKDLLLRELAHRIMNNLQVINSMIRLQLRAAQHEETRQQLQDTAGRVQAVALAYRRLHAIHGVEAVDIGELSSSVAEEVARSMLRSPGQLTVECVSLTLPPEKAMSFALIANELLTNAVKYGGGSEASISLILTRTGTDATLRVLNDIPIVPDAHEPPGGFGTTMIRAMLLELAGDMAAHEKDSRYEVVVTFPLPRPSRQ